VYVEVNVVHVIAMVYAVVLLRKMPVEPVREISQMLQTVLVVMAEPGTVLVFVGVLQ
jgi:hypothetical protein